MKFDDEPTSCAMCSVGLDVDALCECREPLCCRCHRAFHVELLRWGAPGWMGGEVA